MIELPVNTPSWVDYPPFPGFFEAKAILLGRMGRHENALEIYVYRLHDYLKAEEYAHLLPPPAAHSTRLQVLQSGL